MHEFDDDEIPIEERIEEERTKVFMKGSGTKVEKESLLKFWAKLDKRKQLEKKKKLK